jgi:hypothetical protein
VAEPGVEGVVSDAGGPGSLVLEQRFAVVPEWVIDAEISDCAYRLYSVLLRYGQTSGQRMPARATLAGRLHKTSKDTVDRALKELEGIGAVVVERRRRDGRNLTNRYLLMSTPPDARGGETPGHGGRIRAATPGRRFAARRPDPEFLTEKPPPPAPPPGLRAAPAAGADGPSAADPALLAACGIADLSALAEDCQALRRGLGKPTARWTAGRLLPVIAQTARAGSWPPGLVGPALRALAADPATHSPTRLPYPGPWWDTAETGQQPHDRAALVAEQQALEARLAEADGSRVWAQQQARADLAGEPGDGQPGDRFAAGGLPAPRPSRADPMLSAAVRPTRATRLPCRRCPCERDQIGSAPTTAGSFMTRPPAEHRHVRRQRPFRQLHAQATAAGAPSAGRGGPRGLRPVARQGPDQTSTRPPSLPRHPSGGATAWQSPASAGRSAMPQAASRAASAAKSVCGWVPAVRPSGASRLTAGGRRSPAAWGAGGAPRAAG